MDIGPSGAAVDTDCWKKNGLSSDEVEVVETEQQEEVSYYCTFAVTGDQPSFQAIFVCHECGISEGENGLGDSSEDGQLSSSAPLCVCQACADQCQTVVTRTVFIGMGPSTCDCH
jgi:hypothetical protein